MTSFLPPLLYKICVIVQRLGDPGARFHVRPAGLAHAVNKPGPGRRTAPTTRSGPPAAQLRGGTALACFPDGRDDSRDDTGGSGWRSRKCPGSGVTFYPIAFGPEAASELLPPIRQETGRFLDRDPEPCAPSTGGSATTSSPVHLELLPYPPLSDGLARITVG